MSIYFPAWRWYNKVMLVAVSVWSLLWLYHSAHCWLIFTRLLWALGACVTMSLVSTPTLGKIWPIKGQDYEQGPIREQESTVSRGNTLWSVLLGSNHNSFEIVEIYSRQEERNTGSTYIILENQMQNFLIEVAANAMMWFCNVLIQTI